MHAEPFHRADTPPRDRTRTLVAKDGAVWMWPGIPLALELDGTFRPVSEGWTALWARAFHGFDAPLNSLSRAIGEACRHLARSNEPTAQAALDRIDIDSLSPDGAALMRTVAAEFGIEPLDLPVRGGGLPWGSGDQPRQMQLLRSFGRAVEVFEKAGNPDQPRWPKGAPDSQGGRYAPTGASSASSASETPAPGIGHNGGPPLDDIPEIPPEEPATRKILNAVLKNLAGWLLKRGVTALIPGIGEAVAIVQLGIWLYDELPVLDAYLQPPRSLEELQDAVGKPQKGTEIHHIVEQTPARNSGFSEDQIEGPDNKVRISTLKHWQISQWYSTGNDGVPFNGLSPRAYLRGKSWAERYEIGRKALIDFGVLKP